MMTFRLRISIAVLLLWLAGLYNIERLHEPINLASFVYPLSGLLVAGIVCIENLRKLRLAEITAACLLVYAVLKWLLGYGFLGAELPISVTECLVLIVTNVLAWRVAQEIEQVRQIASTLSPLEPGSLPISFDEGEPAMYREVQRARRFHRHLSLATVTCDEHAENPKLESLMQQIRRELAHKHLESRFAAALLKMTETGDLVAYRDGEFILMFPETNSEAANDLVHRVAKELGLTVQVGVAEFPDEECTLSGLIERAELRMRATFYESAGEDEFVANGKPAVLVPIDNGGGNGVDR